MASWGMIDAALSRSIRVRSYRQVVRDAGRTFRLAPGVDVRAALKRAALAAVPKLEGWTLRVFTLERTKEGERVTSLLDRLARAALGGWVAPTSPPPSRQRLTAGVPFWPSRPGIPGASNG